LDNHHFLQTAVVFLLATVIAVPLTKRFRLGAVLGYLLAGVVIGPQALGLISDTSGVATISPSAAPTLQALARSLAPYPNPIRVEGHTDNKPIKTVLFPSNWELSSARAASVVHLLADGGVSPNRLSVIGLGEWRPARPNDTVENRNANRRVLLVILSGTADTTDGSSPMEMPDIHSNEPAQQRAVPGESAAPVSAPSVAPVPASAAAGLPPTVTPSSN
jgi:chemotaxis protein MotB